MNPFDLADRTNPELLAQRAYAAYGASVGWKNYQGLDMPAWTDLGTRIQNAWLAATLEVLKLVARDLGDAD